MNNPPAYQYYAAYFDEDTASWNNEEVGIYQRLLNYSWVNGWNSNEGLPNDPKRLANIVRCNYKKFQKSWEIISKKFSTKEDGFLINRRMEEERRKLIKYIESQAESGRRGVEAKKKRGIFPFDKSSDPSSDPSSDSPSGNQTLLSSSSNNTKVLYSSCPHKKIIELYHNILPELVKIKEWTPGRSKILKKRWDEKEERQTLEWWKGFFEYVKKSNFLMGEKTDFQADLEWLIRPTNFVKVIEGKYENK